MHRARSGAILSAGLLVVACATADVDQTADSPAARQELADQMAAYQRVLLSGDAEGVVAFWTSDIHVLEPSLDLSGDQAREFMRHFLATGRVVSLDVEAYERFVHGEVAYELGEYDETIEVDGEQVKVQNYYFMRWEKGADGVWRFDRFVAGPRDASSGM